MEHIDQETLDMVGTVVLTTVYWEWWNANDTDWTDIHK
jgi:hypothetical protein